MEDGSGLVTQSGRTLGEIVTSVKKVSDIVAEIAAASREQSSGIEQVNRAVMQMDELTQQNAALVEQATAASQAMAEQVRGLNEMLARFQVGMSDIAATTAAQPATPAKPAAAAAHRAERRAANRPWAGRGAKSKPAQQPPAAPKPKAAAPRALAPAEATARGNGTLGAGDAGDSEWQEF